MNIPEFDVYLSTPRWADVWVGCNRLHLGSLVRAYRLLKTYSEWIYSLVPEKRKLSFFFNDNFLSAVDLQNLLFASLSCFCLRIERGKILAWCLVLYLPNCSSTSLLVLKMGHRLSRNTWVTVVTGTEEFLASANVYAHGHPRLKKNMCHMPTWWMFLGIPGDSNPCTKCDGGSVHYQRLCDGDH